MIGRKLLEQNREDCKELPEMEALPNDRWREFVMALFDTRFHQKKAAAIAGFGGESENALRVTAHRMLHDARVQLAINAVSKVYMNSLKPIALAMLKELTDPDKTPQMTPGERLQVVKLITDRTGLQSVQEHKHVVETIESKDTLASIEMLARNLGLDPEKFTGNKLARVLKDNEGPIIDLEPEPDLEDML